MSITKRMVTLYIFDDKE